MSLVAQKVVLRMTDGDLAFSEKILLRRANFWLGTRERVVLIGPNGAGKSTLFKVLAGRQKVDSGQLSANLGCRIFYLPQDFRPTGSTVWEMCYRISPLFGAERALEQAAPNELDGAWREVQLQQHWKSKIPKTLQDFGLGKELWETPTENLSGGEGVRLGLALAFLSGADVLLLDEPTTHLDLKMRLRLEMLLSSYKGAVGVISHDRALIANIAQTVYHLELGVLARVTGGFAVYLSEKDRVRRTIHKALHEAGKETNRLLDSASHIRRVARSSEKKSRQRNQLIRRADWVEKPDPLPPERRWSLDFLAEGTPKLVLEAKELCKSFGERAVIEQANLRIFRGDRIALVGANGSGKSTLLKLLLSREWLDAGERILGLGVRAAYLDQHWHGLEPKRPLLVQFSENFGESRAKTLLGRMRFTPETWNRQLDSFSGGERARAGLAFLAGMRAGLLVMDEPTNHLELELLEGLERSLEDYPGTLLVVSHDRTLVKRVATRFWGIEDGALLEYPSYQDAENAMLGKPALRLSPMGVEVAEKTRETLVVSLEEERERAETLLDDPLISHREETRLKTELLALDWQIQSDDVFAYYRPQAFRVACHLNATTYFADAEGDFWQFWSSAGDFVYASRRGDVFHFDVKIGRRFREAALQICFEVLGAKVVQMEASIYGRSAYESRFRSRASRT